MLSTHSLLDYLNAKIVNRLFLATSVDHRNNWKFHDPCFALFHVALTRRVWQTPWATARSLPRTFKRSKCVWHTWPKHVGSISLKFDACVFLELFTRGLGIPSKNSIWQPLGVHSLVSNGKKRTAEESNCVLFTFLVSFRATRWLISSASFYSLATSNPTKKLLFS